MFKSPSAARVALALATISSTALGAGIAQAQTALPPPEEAAAPQPDDAASDAGSEIVVTAQKRSESLQRVPAAVTALGTDRLESLGVSNLDQIGNLAPGISVVPVRSQAFIFVRGVGQTLTTPNADAAVATNFNGVYLPAEIAGTAFFDVGRIEVLPGPQGTLYGRNAAGGVININSRMPGDSFGVNGFVELGNYDRRQVVVGVDIPLAPNVLSRTAGTIVRHDGYTSNGIDDQRNWAIRQTLVFTPSEQTTVTGVATYTHDGGFGNAWQNVPPADCGDRCASFDPRALGYYNDTDTFQASLEVNQQFGDALTLTYLGGYSHLDLDVNGTLWIGPPLAPLAVQEKIDIQTHELRLNAELGRFNGIAGLYYFDQDTSYRNDIRPAPTQRRGSPFDAGAHGWAMFGQGMYEVASGIRLTAGLRYSRTVKDIDGANVTLNPTTGALLTSTRYVGRSELGRLDWKAGVEADLTPDSMFYANISTGFTPGGFSTEQAVPGQAAAAPFKPVKLLAYVVGIKNRLADSKLTLNLEGYYYDYKNYQVSARDTLTGRNLVYNAEKATIYGAQLDMRYAPSRQDDFVFTANYLHAKADRLLTPIGRFDGYDLPYAPKWTLNAYYQRSFDVGGGSQLRADVNFKYSSRRWSLYSHGTGFDIAANTNTSVNFGYFAPDERWYAQAFVRNLEDSLVKTSCGTARPGPAGCFYEPPRTYGVRVGFKL